MKIQKFKFSYYLALLFFCFITVVACDQKEKVKDETVFKVVKTTQPIEVDGILDEPVWQKSEIQSFNYFFDVEKPSDQQKTMFRMLWDETNLYLFYECEDHFITAKEKIRDGAPYLDDCAEIFLIPIPEPAKMHYGIEVNLFKTSNDFIYFNDFYNGEFASAKGFNPDIEIAFTINGTLNDNSDIDKGWTMEMAIPIKSFLGVDKFYPVKEGSKWKFLALRQDRNEIAGERRIASTNFPTNKDVHDPNVFGLLEFVKPF